MPPLKKYILALDQGTSSSKAFLFDHQGQVVSRAGRDFRQIYPRPGWVEHDPLEIWESQLAVAKEAISLAGISIDAVAAIGITNQRETTVLWDKATGKPVFNAIVWQCRRTAKRCERLRSEGFDRVIKARTGLVTDAYFSGTKVEWILDNVPGCRTRAEKGEILFGTVDSWLIYNLTAGKVHATDCSNASRTLLFDIHRHQWDDEILRKLRIPSQVLPAVRPSSCTVGETDARLFGIPIPISGNAGDQQAALFGQTCFRPGQAKNTYGTGCFMLLNTGTQAVTSQDLLTTIAWGLDGQVDYALEGSVFIAGAAVQWLRDELGIIGSSAMKRDSAISLQVLGVDGGAAVNDLLCQFQADILGVPVERPAVAETTALGSAYLAGLAAGFWNSKEEIMRNHRIEKRYQPAMGGEQREGLYRGWVRAVERARGWAQSNDE
jgi:glycerol kinase